MSEQTISSAEAVGTLDSSNQSATPVRHPELHINIPAHTNTETSMLILGSGDAPNVIRSATPLSAADRLVRLEASATPSVACT